MRSGNSSDGHPPTPVLAPVMTTTFPYMRFAIVVWLLPGTIENGIRKRRQVSARRLHLAEPRGDLFEDFALLVAPLGKPFNEMRAWRMLGDHSRDCCQAHSHRGL